MAADHNNGRWPTVVLYDAFHCNGKMWLDQRLARRKRNAAGRVQQHGPACGNAESTDAQYWNSSTPGPRDVAWSATSPAAGEHPRPLTGADVASKNGGCSCLRRFDDRTCPPLLLARSSSQGFRAGVMTVDDGHARPALTRVRPTR